MEASRIKLRTSVEETSWAGAEILVNPFVRAIQAEHLIALNLFVAVAFRYSSAFVSSSDSASQ